ncbi:MAG: geranylgeranyl reductase family protein [Candidatus Thorarchaeota archaeon]|nr:geranylgeranyl reductase family protein [Candidatus Thorarchaeota archaeon]
MKKPDVVVVGAGSAGSVTARRCAEMGLKTLLLDKKSREQVGQKVCGDEISKSHFEATGIDIPSGKEVSSVIAGADVYPPNMQNELKVRGWAEFDGWTVNRLEFGQRLLSEAIYAGVAFKSGCRVCEPIVRGDKVIGVVYREGDSKEEISVYSKLVVDASGFAAIIRNKLDHSLVEESIDKEDVALCYREILRLKMPLAEPEVARVLLGGSIAPSGYAWIFPKGPQEINAGVGVTGGEGRGSPKPHFLKFKEEYPLLIKSQVIDAAGGAVPVRRPLKSLVADGVAFVGDAACQVNPIHGGGLGAGMRAGIILGEVAKSAIARRRLDAEGIWSYNTRFQSNFGKRLASLEIFRRLLQSVDDEDMNYGFEKRILEAEDLMAANRGDGISMSVLEKAKRVKRSAGRIGLLLKIRKAGSLMKKIAKIYEAYPSDPEKLEEWNSSVLQVLEKTTFE